MDVKEKSQKVIDELTDDQIQSVLTAVQEMFYENSKIKTGLNAGALTLPQFEEGKPTPCSIVQCSSNHATST